MTRKEYYRRVAALKDRFAYLFAGQHIGHGIYPGWLDILEELCVRIDNVVAETERQCVYFTQIKEKFGGLRAYLSIAPRLDVVAGDGTRLSRYLETAQKRLSLFDRTEPLVHAAETRSYATCIFCSAPGVLRRERSWVLTLCDLHSQFGHHDLDVAFEGMTSQYATPPDLPYVVTSLRHGADELHDPGVVRMGVLPPEPAEGPYRIVLSLAEPGLWPGRDIEHAAGRAIGWPVRIATLAVDAAAPEGITWITGEPS